MEKTTWLQGIGKVKGKPAREFKEGDIMRWNYGYRSKVLAINKTTPKYMEFVISGGIGTEREKESFTRRLKKERIVAL